MKLGLVTYNLANEWDLPTIIDKCSKHGFHGVEARTTHAHGIELELSTAQRAEVKKQFDDSPVALCGLGSTYEYHSADETEVRQNINGTKEYVKLAHDVGCPGVKVRPNGVQTSKGIPLEKTLDQIGLALRECATFAQDYGVEIRLEIHGQVTCEVPHCKTIMEVADHPNALLCWNSNQSDLVDGSIDANFESVRDKIALVHMRDICLPEYPWAHLLQLLKQSGYARFTCAEIPGNEDPDRIMGYYSALWKAYTA